MELMNCSFRGIETFCLSFLIFINSKIILLVLLYEQILIIQVRDILKYVHKMINFYKYIITT